MAHRHAMGNRESQHDFSRKAGVHPMNTMPTSGPGPMRGGFRL